MTQIIGPLKVGKLADPHDLPVSFASGEAWYAIRTNIKCERRAQMGIDAMGYRTYLPQCIRWVTHARTRERARRPLFPRYLFVEIDMNRDGTDDIRRTDGVESILGNAGVPIGVPGRFVTDLLVREMKGEFDYVKDDKLTKGTKIAIMDGEFAGLIAVLTGGKNRFITCKVEGYRHETKLALASVRAA